MASIVNEERQMTVAQP